MSTNDNSEQVEAEVEQCAAIVEEEPLQYCGDEAVGLFKVTVGYDGGVADGEVWFCDEHSLDDSKLVEEA